MSEHLTPEELDDLNTAVAAAQDATRKRAAAQLEELAARHSGDRLMVKLRRKYSASTGRPVLDFDRVSGALIFKPEPTEEKTSGAIVPEKAAE